MKDKEISFEERKSLQLEMLKEIDAFCRKNSIRYALSCGTLIGAVRHNGYIPWDDDVDITMMYTDMQKFRQCFESENLKYCDIDTEPNYEFHFSRIVSKKTYSKLGFKKRYGVCIDIYPIIECTDNLKTINKLVAKGSKFLKKRLTYIKWYYRILKFTPFSTLPGFKESIRNYYDFMINEVQLIGGGNYYQMGGPLEGTDNNFYHNMWNFNPLEEVVNHIFENETFWIPAKYDKFLTTRYGDYMKLPPEDERIAYHGGHYYWNK